MAKLRLTGGAGFIGSYVVDLFSEKRCEVIIGDLSTERTAKINLQVNLYQRGTCEETELYFKEKEQVA